MLDSASIGMIAAMVVMVICSAYFSATETAFTSLNRIRLKSKADAGNRRAARALELVDKYDNLLSTILVGNNIVNLTASSLSTLFFTVGLKLQNGAVIATAVITIVVLIFGEVSPKSLAKEAPEQFAMFSAPIIGTLMVILTPVNWFFAALVFCPPPSFMPNASTTRSGFWLSTREILFLPSFAVQPPVAQFTAFTPSYPYSSASLSPTSSEKMGVCGSMLISGWPVEDAPVVMLSP